MPWRSSRICVRCGSKFTWRSAVAIACSWLIRTCDCWQPRETTNASTRTPTMTSTRGQVAPVRERREEASDRWTELVPDVREEHDHNDDDRAQDRDGKHRDLEALHVRLLRRELDLALAAAVVD